MTLCFPGRGGRAAAAPRVARPGPPGRSVARTAGPESRQPILPAFENRSTRQPTRDGSRPRAGRAIMIGPKGGGAMRRGARGGAGLDWHATTILSVRRGDRVAIGGDGQVTLGTTVMKG